MYVITYFNRRCGRAIETKFETLDLAKAAAEAIFQQTGIIVGIENAK